MNQLIQHILVQDQEGQNNNVIFIIVIVDTEADIIAELNAELVRQWFVGSTLSNV